MRSCCSITVVPSFLSRSRVRARRARVLAAVERFEHDVSPERHAPCDILERLGELADALACDVDEERDALDTTERDSIAGPVPDEETD